MNVLSRDKKIEIVAALTEGLGVRATARICNTNRGTVAALALRIGRGCERLHDGMMTGLRVSRLEIDELWAYVGKKQRNITRKDGDDRGDQYTFIALGAASKAIISYRTGKRNGDNTQEFISDLRERVLGSPEISSDSWSPYQPAIRSAFGNRVAYGQISKTYSVTHLSKSAAGRYSPAQVIAVSRDVVSGVPAEISTSYVERSHLTLRMSSKRFARLSNGFSKRLEHHAAAVSLYVGFYNLCRWHEALKTTPAVAVGITDHVWSIGELLDAAEKKAPQLPVPTAPDRRKQFQVIEGGKN